GPIVRLAVSRDGRLIVSSSEDRTIKLWDAVHFAQVEQLSGQSDWSTALALAPAGNTLAAGRMDGSLAVRSIAGPSTVVEAVRPLDYSAPPVIDPSLGMTGKTQSETEPNDSPTHPMDVALPARIDGVIALGKDGRSDVDFYRFRAKAGQ